MVNRSEQYRQLIFALLECEQGQESEILSQHRDDDTDNTDELLLDLSQKMIDCLQSFLDQE